MPAVAWRRASACRIPAASEGTPVTVQAPSAALAPSVKIIAVCCGVGAAACWGVGLTAARHGIAIGLSPADLAFHRFMGFLEPCSVGCRYSGIRPHALALVLLVEPGDLHFGHEYTTDRRGFLCNNLTLQGCETRP